jgi:CMP-N,N'-diacetyllegionaminic acid synthase
MGLLLKPGYETNPILKNIAVIPARSGSKRIPLKNFKILGGKPLIAYTIEEALKSRHIQRIVISTDYGDIDQFLQHYDRSKLKIHRRPEALAGDLVTTEEVLLHILGQDWAVGVEYIVTLPPTTPFRSAKTIDGCIELFLNKKADSVLSISGEKIRAGSYDPHTRRFAFKMKKPPSKMSEWPFTYFDNSSVYVTKAEVLRQQKFIIGPITYGYEIDKIEGFDINEPFDWAIAAKLIYERYLP